MSYYMCYCVSYYVSDTLVPVIAWMIG
jgi:hypothetical protein